MKEKIHALSEEMVANLGRLVAIDSQLGTPEHVKVIMCMDVELQMTKDL